MEKILHEDGLALPDVGIWAKTKYKKICYYDEMFSGSMKNKWSCRVYLDLFSAAGKSIIRENNEIVLGSPLLALSVNPQFDEYIFCEEQEENIEALKKRVSMYYPDSNCKFLHGNSNDNVERIISLIPKFSKSFKGLTFCFLDPYKTSELKFSTIEKLANSLYIDFLILIPSFMDINRNLHSYIREDDDTIDNFLGTKDWRKKWQLKQNHISFGNFITLQFCERMKSIGFLFESEDDLELVKLEKKNVPLYHLAFFSKNKLGLKFWRETQKNTNEQLSFSWE